MNGYPEFSSSRGVALAAVVLLHLILGYALYNGLGAQIKKAFDPAPFNLLPVERLPQPVEPPPRVPLISQVKLYVPSPEVAPSLPPTEPEIAADLAPPEPPKIMPPAAPAPSVRVSARLDPKHPLRIGAAYYPDASVRANEMGRCVVQATVAIDGRIIAAAIQSGTGFARLDLACMNAVRGQRMLPALDNGKPIESTVSIPIVWNLSDAGRP